jgi:hypothetical protein
VFHVVDFSGNRFQMLDFREGVVAFNPVTVCQSPLKFLAWGVVVNQWAAIDLFGQDGERLPAAIRSRFPCPLYSAGWGRLTFEDVAEVNIRLTPIAPSLIGETAFMTENGDNVAIEKKCVVEGPATTSRTHTEGLWYDIASYLEQPYGDLYLSICAKGKVYFEWALESCVPYDDYLSQSKEYECDIFRDRQLIQFSSDP